MGEFYSRNPVISGKAHLLPNENNLLVKEHFNCPDLSGQEGHPIWFSAGIAHLLQSLMCSLFRDALLQMLVVKSSYFLSAPFHQPEELSPE